jgi:hypothetical protein
MGRGKDKASTDKTSTAKDKQRKTRKQAVKALNGLTVEQLQQQRKAKGELRGRLIQQRTMRRYLTSMMLLTWYCETFDETPLTWSDVPAAIESFFEYLYQELIPVNVANNTLACFTTCSMSTHSKSRKQRGWQDCGNLRSRR